MSRRKNGRKSLRVDVAIIGGGTASSAAALALAKKGLSAQVIERSSGAGWKVGESLPPEAKPLLCQLGVWERFTRSPHLISYGNSSAWGTRRLDVRDFIYGANGHGWHLDRQVFDSMLAGAAAEAGVKRHCRARVTGWRRKAVGGWRLEVSSEDDSFLLDADFVIDACGRASWFARQQGVRRERHDLLIGIVGLFNPGERTADRNTLTIVESVRDGWWHAALLPDKRLVVTYFTDADLAHSRRAGSKNCWLALSQEAERIHARLRVNGYQPPDSLRTCCANSSRLSKAAGASWLAVGDAAIAYDPLSSQGIVMALATSLAAAEAIQEYLGNKDDGRLAEYTDWLARSHEDYLISRHSYYALERRWPDAPFWSRRHAQPLSPAWTQNHAGTLLNDSRARTQNLAQLNTS